MSINELIDRAEDEWRDRFVEGPTELAWGQLPPQVGDDAPDAVLADHTGTTRRLSETWQDGPALILFWRHFACGCGLDRAARLRDELDDYREAGAEVVIVGQGEPERAAAYRDDQDLDVPVLCDPELDTYRAYGLIQFQVAQVLFDAPQEFWSHDREHAEELRSARRERGRPMVDDPWRQPGDFVVDSGGTIRLAYRWQYCEDLPDPRVLTTAISLAS